MISLRSIARVFVLVVLLLVAGGRVASATHFHGGTLNWQQDTSSFDPINFKVTITGDFAFRWSYPFPTAGANPAVGVTIPSFIFLQLSGTGYSQVFELPIVVTSILSADDLLTAAASINVVIPKTAFPLMVQHASSDRASTLAEGNHDRPYVLTTVIDLDPSTGTTRSPVSTALPRVRLPVSFTSIFQLPSQAFNGLTNHFSFTPAANSGLLTPRPNGTLACATGLCTDLLSNVPPYSLGMEVSDNGTITWMPAYQGLYAAQFTITSKDAANLPHASIPVDMEFEVLMLCGPGSYGVDGEPPCLLAPAGKYASGFGNTQATLCPPGYFSSSPGAAACTAAAPGSYADGLGNISSTPCAPGYFSSVPASTSCMAAPAGSYASGTGNAQATQCPAGYFTNLPASIACVPAPAGSYASGLGNTSSTPCAAGYFSSVAGSAACTAAPAGSYASGTGNTQATPCPTGSFSSVSASASCTLAPAGSFVSLAGSTSTTLCAAGTFSSTVGAIACTPCPAGTTSAAGATACTSVALLIHQAITAYLGDSGLANSLHQDVDAIVTAPNATAKSGKLGAFINHVNAQRGKALTNTQADNLIALALLL